MRQFMGDGVGQEVLRVFHIEHRIELYMVSCQIGLPGGGPAEVKPDGWCRKGPVVQGACLVEIPNKTLSGLNLEGSRYLYLWCPLLHRHFFWHFDKGHWSLRETCQGLVYPPNLIRADLADFPWHRYTHQVTNRSTR